MRPCALFLVSEHESHIICGLRKRRYRIVTYFVSKLRHSYQIYAADRACSWFELRLKYSTFFLSLSSGPRSLALAKLTNMPPLGKFILLSFSNLVIIIVVNSPMNKLIAFCTHFSLICMMTGVGNIAIRSASTARFQ
jgi:hypothetical protein